MTAEETYLSWLRYALWGGDSPNTSANNDLFTLANRQKTRGLIYEALLRDPSGLTQETAKRMRQFLLQNLSTHLMLDKALARIMVALHEAGIPAVLLKGQGIARNYPDPKLRECGDIDIYIGPERLEEAVRVLTPLADKVDDELHGKHWQLWIGQAEIELHQHTMLLPTRRQTRFYRTLEAEGLRRGLVPLDFGGVRVDTPEDTFNAFYIFFHAWHHFASGGIGFRQLCDWTLLLHTRRESIDRERLRAMLKGMGLLVPWQLFGCIAVRDLGLSEAEFPFYDGKRLTKSRRVLDMILAEGNFGRGIVSRRPRPEGYLAGKAWSLVRHCRRFFQMLRFSPRQAWLDFRSIFIHGWEVVFKDRFHQ